MSPESAKDAVSRRQRRISVGLVLHISGNERDGRPFSEIASSANISRTGAQFSTIRNLTVGSEVQVLIPRPPGATHEEDFVAQARVVRVTPGESEETRIVGVEFLNARYHRVFVPETSSE